MLADAKLSPQFRASGGDTPACCYIRKPLLGVSGRKGL